MESRGISELSTTLSVSSIDPVHAAPLKTKPVSHARHFAEVMRTFLLDFENAAATGGEPAGSHSFS
jgi:hypothetical protein